MAPKLAYQLLFKSILVDGISIIMILLSVSMYYPLVVILFARKSTSEIHKLLTLPTKICREISITVHNSNEIPC